MSTLKVNNLTNSGATGLPAFNGVAGNRLLPSAWVNFNGTGTVAIRDAQNVSSITDNGVGDYTVNFTTPMNNTNFAPVVSVQCSTSYFTTTLAAFASTGGTSVPPTTTTARFFCAAPTIGAQDSAYVNITIFGGF